MFITLMGASGNLMNQLNPLGRHPNKPDEGDELADEDEEDGPSEGDGVIQNSSEGRTWNIIEWSSDNISSPPDDNKTVDTILISRPNAILTCTMHKLTHEGPEGEHGGPQAGHEAVGVDGVGEAALDGGLVRVRES